jgi:hypothetical protein
MPYPEDTNHIWLCVICAVMGAHAAESAPTANVGPSLK